MKTALKTQLQALKGDYIQKFNFRTQNGKTYLKVVLKEGQVHDRLSTLVNEVTQGEGYMTSKTPKAITYRMPKENTECPSTSTDA